MQATVTQFVRPNGHQVLRDVFIDDSCAEQYNEIVESGCRITVEVTSNGDFFICIEDTIVEGDFITDIFHEFNAKNFIDGTSKVISKFNVVDLAKWREVERRINGEEPPF